MIRDKVVKTIKTTLGVLVLAVMVGCGEQYQAKNLTKSFITDNVKGGNVKILFVSPLDSTRHLSDHVLESMRQRALKNVVFQQPLSFSPIKSGEGKKLFVRVKYILTDKSPSDTLVNTLYMDENLEGVVALKNG